MGISIENDGAKYLEKTFSAERVNSAAIAAVNAMAEVAGDLLDEGFQNESTPGGQKWQQLSAGYASWKERTHGSSKILYLEGSLKSAALQSIEGYRSQLTAPGIGEASATFSGPAYAEYVAMVRPFFVWDGQAEDKIKQAGTVAGEVELGG